MPRRPRGGAPGQGAEHIAALTAETGSVAAAARELGVGRGTLDGILTGTQNAGKRVMDALRGLSPARRVEIRETEQRLGAGGQTGRSLVDAAKAEARSERRSRGTTRAATEAHRDRMAAVGLDMSGNLLGDADSLGRRLTPQQRIYAELNAMVDAGWSDGSSDDRYELLVAIHLGSPGGGTDEDIEPLFYE